MEISISSEHQSSIEVSQNAKGDYSWSVKVYGDDDEMIKEKLKKYKNIAQTIAKGDNNEG